MRQLAGIVVLSAVTAPAMAQQPPKEWTGEGVFNASLTQGNTETSDVGLGFKIKHASENWTQSAELVADYGQKNDVESKNRLYGAGQIDRIYSPKWSAYVRGSAEHDEFSGFENRYFLGVGGAYRAIKNDRTDWVIQGGPGYKVDEVRATTTAPIIPAKTKESVGAQVVSNLKHKLNDKVALSNNTDVLYANTSTQVRNVVALTVDIMGNLKARASYDVRYETDPRAGFKSTDTTTKFSLVYTIG